MPRAKPKPAPVYEVIEVPYVPGTRRICATAAKLKPLKPNPNAGWTNDPELAAAPKRTGWQRCNDERLEREAMEAAAAGAEADTED